MARLFAWFSTLLAAWFGLLFTASTTYPFPPAALDGISTWLNKSSPALIAFTAVRGICIVAITYLFITSALLALTAKRHRRIGNLVRRISLPSVNTFVLRASGLGIATALVLQMEPAVAAPINDVPVLRHLLPGEAVETTTTSSTSSTSTTLLPPPPVESPTPAPADAPAQQHQVERGESFWTIAAKTLTEQLQRPPTERELTAYWQRLIDANRHRLHSPANPDVLFAGQVLQLPQS